MPACQVNRALLQTSAGPAVRDQTDHKAFGTDARPAVRRRANGRCGLHDRLQPCLKLHALLCTGAALSLAGLLAPPHR